MFVEVDDAPRCADDDVNGGVVEQVFLVFYVDPAIDGEAVQTGVGTDLIGVFFDLHGEFACRCQHDRPRPFGFGVNGVGEQVVVQRDKEGSRLAGTGLRQAHHVMSAQGQRQGFFLYRRSVGQAVVFQRFLDGLMDGQAAESGIGCMVFCHVVSLFLEGFLSRKLYCFFMYRSFAPPCLAFCARGFMPLLYCALLPFSLFQPGLHS